MHAQVFPPAHQAAKEFRTLRDILRWAVSSFHAHKLSFGQGTDNAWDEAVYLALASLKLPLDMLEPFLDARLSSSERLLFCFLLGKCLCNCVPYICLLAN